MKLYVSSLFQNHVAAANLCAVLEANGHQIVFRWWEDVPLVPDPRWLRARAHDELEAVRGCDVLVLLRPAARGSHAELGAALVLGKPCVVVGPEEPEERACPFHYHPRCHRFEPNTHHVVSVGLLLAHLAALQAEGLEPPAPDAVTAAQQTPEDLQTALGRQATAARPPVELQLLHGDGPEARYLCTSCGKAFNVDATTETNLEHNGKELVEVCPWCGGYNNQKAQPVALVEADERRVVQAAGAATAWDGEVEEATIEEDVTEAELAEALHGEDAGTVVLDEDEVGHE